MSLVHKASKIPRSIIWYNWNLCQTFQPDSMRIMGDKSTARDTMKKAGVPTVPGTDGLVQVFILDTGI